MSVDVVAELERRGRLGQRLRLEIMEGMLAELGDFHRDMRVVHVGGTNGKGSVSAMVAAALEAAGHRTGLYTSPHLVRFHERIRVDGKDVTDAELARAYAEVEPALAAFADATYFEAATLLALRHFARAGVDVAVLEVGLGGRLDATNVFPAPLATVVTNVTLEHADVLGRTVAEIAREKAGIVKRGVPLVTGATGEALAVLREAAAAHGAPLRSLGDDFVAIPGEVVPDGQTLEVDGLRDYGEVRIPLLGDHQVENAVLALAALDAVDAAGLAVPVEAARAGLARTRWPGRLQIVRRRPLVVLDGAHNPAGVEALARWLAREGLRPVLVFGALQDKDWRAMVETLIPHVREGIVARVPTPRSIEPMEAARLFSQNGLFGMTADDPGMAMRMAESLAREDGAILVAGSLYLVGDVLGRLAAEAASGARK